MSTCKSWDCYAYEDRSQESRMREICTSGSTRGRAGRLHRRLSLSTLLFPLYSRLASFPQKSSAVFTGEDFHLLNRDSVEFLQSLRLWHTFVDEKRV